MFPKVAASFHSPPAPQFVSKDKRLLSSIPSKGLFIIILFPKSKCNHCRESTQERQEEKENLFFLPITKQVRKYE